jgi:predicted AAA+ superfamily ATPase
MYGLTQGEITRSGTAGSLLTRLFGTADPVVGTMPGAPGLTDYITMAVRGGFPDAVNLSDFARSAWYEGYVEQLVRHDVNDLDTVRLPAAMTNLLRGVALNTAGTPSVIALAEAAGIDQRTTRIYLDLLESLRVVERMPAWRGNRFTRLVKVPKYHIVDTGMAAQLAGDDHQGLMSNGTRLGRIVESFVAAQVRPLYKLGIPSISCYHLRDANGKHEIDLILESAAGRVVGIEVKSGKTIAASDGKHLAWLRDQLGQSFVRGIVLHTGNMTFPLGPKLWAMPIASLWT